MRKASKREVQQVYRAVIEKCGATFLYIEHRDSAHPFLHYEVDGQRLKHSLPGTSSDHRAVKNVISDLRRRIREWKEKTEGRV